MRIVCNKRDYGRKKIDAWELLERQSYLVKDFAEANAASNAEPNDKLCLKFKRNCIFINDMHMANFILLFLYLINY